MDPTRFDALARALAAPGTRRRFVAGLAAGALGALGLRAPAAAACRAVGGTCREHANCCSALCGAKDRSGRHRCACATLADCPVPDQCHAATCTAGACGETVLTGQACDDGSRCTTGETCQANGTCGGGTATVCRALDQCHLAGACDPATGSCTNPAKPNGTGCDDGDACTRTDTCQDGVCTGSNRVVCTAQDACHVAGTCDPRTGVCSDPATKPDGSDCGSGRGCCGGVCTDLATVSDCGGCGTVCPGPTAGSGHPTCVDGACGIACAGGFHVCGGACAGDDSVTQCGAGCADCTANVPANAVPTCSSGSCAYPCDTANGASACGSVCCGRGQACCGGACMQATGAPCTADGDCCSGVCVNRTCQAEPGGAGATCDSDADCAGGRSCCNATCVETGTDVNNCGGCGTVCPGPTSGSSRPTCVDGACAIACASGFHACGGACVRNDSVTKCGPSCADCTANVPANAFPFCAPAAGQCIYPCNVGFTACPDSTGQWVCLGVTGTSCQVADDCCFGICAGHVCRQGCSGNGELCSVDADCCSGGLCLNVTDGVGHCCASGVACGTTCCAAGSVCTSDGHCCDSGTACGPHCCAPNTACTTAFCSGGTCFYRGMNNCCIEDGQCPSSNDPCERPICDPATHTCGIAPVGCPTGEACCGGVCVDFQSDAGNCGGCGTTCTAGAPTSSPFGLVCCQTGTCSTGRCGFTCIAFCPSCATPACDPTEGAICASNCPAPDLCHTGPGICQDDGRGNGTCVYPAKCPCEATCDPSTGTCGAPNCGPCETCDVSSGQCVSTCTSPPDACSVSPGSCVNGQCRYTSLCRACHHCDGNGQCSPKPGNVIGRPCDTCRVCDENYNCVPQAAATSCAFGPNATPACHDYCDGRGNCVNAPEGYNCGDGYTCDGNGTCTCINQCGTVCCPGSQPYCCVGLVSSTCCAAPCSSCGIFGCTC